MRKGVALAAAVLMTVMAGQVQAERRCEIPRGVVCDGEFLSWVEIKFFNDETRELLNQDAASYTEKTRGYLRREIPDLEHEVVDPMATLDGNKEASYRILALDRDEAIRKVLAQCIIALNKNGPATGIYIECDLYTFLDFRNAKQPDVSTAVIGSGANVQDHDKGVTDLLRETTKSLSDRFYSQLSRSEMEQ